ncbi:MAG: NUDIX hydrolase [Candidatus Latescibacteria bacterium]|jgi:ADP-ribose pyrophosphatase|nr:NUDIX hydrolase [Gemmatimonadaceae bacterium]MDP6015335.1 NUDIX hydrolase [Candidatus Latescibacterota bacterium]MDP7450088.1 NUDIX hydrolase [Candidatus Latescibacterota bacterium]HJP31994.1 NUDIX hydrolase [Candidatus Latescibacterota bacterium]|tara:strand:- start:654 stop:1232 length:579 start_codon:yes stop_codon:yes gene_type:complete
MNRRVDIQSRQLLADGFFRLEEVVLRHERLDGSMSEPMSRMSLERGDGAAILLHDPDRQVVTLVRQFRYPTWEHGPGWTLELVAGVIEAGREPEHVARAEAREEAGYHVNELESLGAFYLTPGGSSERIFLYYAAVNSAMRVDEGGGLAHEGEDIEIIEMAEDDVWRALDDHRITDAKTLVGLMWLRLRRFS